MSKRRATRATDGFAVLGRAFLPMALGLAVCLWAGSGWADTIYLTNGRKIIGIIEEGGSDETKVMIRTSTGTVPIPRSNIQRIEIQEARSQAEASAALAEAGKDLDRARDLYLKAYQENPQNEQLREKIESLTQQIRERDEKIFGAAFEKIQKEIDAGDFEKAIAEAESFLSRVKQDSALQRFKQLVAGARIGIARQHKDKVDYPKAEEQYKLAMEVYPEGPQAYFELGTLLQLTPARKTEAIPLFEKGTELARAEPDMIDEKTLNDYQYQLAQTYLQSQQHTKAADLFLLIARNDKAAAYPTAINQMLDAYSRLDLSAPREDMDHIIGNLKAAIELNPTTQRAMVLLGRIYFAREDWEQASQTLDHAVKLTASTNPALQEALYFLAVSYRRMGKIDQAAETLKMVYDQGTPTYDVICEYAEVRLAQVGLDPALELFNQARAVDRDKYRSYLGLGDTLILLKRFKEARDNYQEVILRDPLNFPAQLAIGKTFYLEEMMPEAASQAERTIAQMKQADPNLTAPGNRQLMAEAYTLLGEASVAQDQINMAQDSFGKALGMIENYPPALNGMGIAYQSDSKYPEAEKYFDRAIASDPKNPDYRLSLGIFYHKYLKRTGDALPNYLAYLDLGGKDPNVHTWIEDCGGTSQR